MEVVKDWMEALVLDPGDDGLVVGPKLKHGLPPGLKAIDCSRACCAFTKCLKTDKRCDNPRFDTSLLAYGMNMSLKTSGATLSDADIIKAVRCCTSVSAERIQNVLDLVAAVVLHRIPGDLVEIGVWKGGLVMAMALKCKQLGDMRTIHAYDTFEGMTPAENIDVDLGGVPAISNFENVRSYSSFQETKANIDQAGYPGTIAFHKGDIVLTPAHDVPGQIALLRLDTDWYASTTFEMRVFEPRVAAGGFVIVDDYGHWKGCKQAVDEFLVVHPHTVHRIDYTGIWWWKVK